MKTLQLSELNFDQSLLELRGINEAVVSTYRQAYRSGKDLGRITVDQDYNIVSGNHRVSAMLAEFGEEHEIEVEGKRFASEADRVAYFAEQNLHHGLQLTSSQRRAITLRLLDNGKEAGEVANLFGVSVKRIEKWAGLSFVVLEGGKRVHKPMKRGLEHLAGRQISQSNYQQHWKQDRGVRVSGLASQLTRWLNNGFVDFDNDADRQALMDLMAALEEHSDKLCVTA